MDRLSLQVLRQISHGPADLDTLKDVCGPGAGDSVAYLLKKEYIEGVDFPYGIGRNKEILTCVVGPYKITAEGRAQLEGRKWDILDKFTTRVIAITGAVTGVSGLVLGIVGLVTGLLALFR